MTTMNCSLRKGNELMLALEELKGRESVGVLEFTKLVDEINHTNLNKYQFEYVMQTLEEVKNKVR